jgi:hypothetical protein
MEGAKRIVRGFPVALRDDVHAVAAVLPEPTHLLEARAQRVSVRGEPVEIAARIYNPQPVCSAIKTFRGLSPHASIPVITMAT